MIRRYGGQRSLFEAALGPDLVESLIDPTLRRLDAVLADDSLVTAVFQRQAGRFPHSRDRGRPGTPADIILRLLVLQRVRGWTFDETEREVRASLVYRWVTHIYLGSVPDAKTLVRQSMVLGDAGVRALHERIVTVARTERHVQGRRARVDTTVVETNVHYPTDATLLMDGLRVLTRTAHRVAAATGHVALRIRNRLRAANRRVREIGRASRGSTTHGRERLQEGYRRLLALTRATLRDARRVLQVLEQTPSRAVRSAIWRAVLRARDIVRTFVPRVEQVIAQTRARVFGGNTHYPGKLLSLFEPHTEAIRKGKAAKPTEFGHLVKIQEAEHGLIVDYDVYEHRPADTTLLPSTIDCHKKAFGRAPYLLAADAGFWSGTNRTHAEEAGVKRVCVPATGRPSNVQRRRQHERWFRRGQRWRTGSEGRVSLLKRRDGLSRCRYRHFTGSQRWTGWGVLAHNIRLLINATDQPSPAR
jgi:IS5 family transposase